MITLYHGDCLFEMYNISPGSVDLILCDLPYQTTTCDWDKLIPFEPLWELYWRVLKKNGAILLFGAEPFSSNLRLSQLNQFRYDYYWKKERLTNVLQVKKRPAKTIEIISVFYKESPYYNPQMTPHTGRKSSNAIKNGKLGRLVDNGTKSVKPYTDTGFRYPDELLQFKRDILTCNLHPTQKPVALLEYLIKTYTREGETVLDNTMGSGSTGVAALNLNRNFIGIELDKEYFEIASNRLLAAQEKFEKLNWLDNVFLKDSTLKLSNE